MLPSFTTSFQIGFGGHGYGHIINNVLPRMLLKGLSAEQVDQISITNPANWLQYAC